MILKFFKKRLGWQEEDDKYDEFTKAKESKEELGMRLIVGLGNPGAKYKGTRHNIGFEALDKIAGFESWDKKGKSKICKARIGSKNVLLAKPQTYMNLSGEAVQSLMTTHKIKPHEICVLVDDVNIPAGTIRIRAKGSHGGQNGLRDIIQRIGNEFCRVRLGVGSPQAGQDLSQFVLSKPQGQQADDLVHMLDKMNALLEVLLEEGPEKAQSQFNGK